jgi:hypothetical protein
MVRVGYKDIQIVGYDELNRQLKSLGKNFPKAKVRQAANKAVNLPLKEAKKNAPVLSGALKKGLVKWEEKKWKLQKKKKKAVFQVSFNSAMNSIFQKKIDNPGIRGGQTAVNYAYYPFSQEYGFHVTHGKMYTSHKGYKFIENAVENKTNDTLDLMIDELLKTIKKLASKP